LCKKKLVHHSKKEKNTDTRATAVTKLLALKNDYLNNPKRKKTQDKDSQKEQTNKQKLKNSESPHQHKNKQRFFPHSISPNSLFPNSPKIEN